MIKMQYDDLSEKVKQMDDTYHVTLRLTKQEYDAMKQIIATHSGKPIDSICGFGIANYFHNIISDLIYRGYASRDGKTVKL